MRNYGSEDREVEKFVPPNNLIYEFIVFRSTEIQNLIVLTEKGDEGSEKKDTKNEQTNNQSKKD